MRYTLRTPTRDELICIAPGPIAFTIVVAIGVLGALMAGMPRTVWMFVLLIVAGGLLTFFLSLTPPVLHARQRMLQANIIEPTQMDEEPDLAASDTYDKTTGGGHDR